MFRKQKIARKYMAFIPASIETLRAARVDIQFPENWTTGAWARHASGRTANPQSKRAICWCAAGALMRYAGVTTFTMPFISMASGDKSGLVGFNDKHTHREVLALFDFAIGELQKAHSRFEKPA